MSTTRLVGAPPGPNRQAPGREDAAADRLPAVRGRRDIFPLPHVTAYIGEEVLQLRRDRGSRRMQWMIRQINCLVTALNWMHGFKGEDRELIATYPLKYSFGVGKHSWAGDRCFLEEGFWRALGFHRFRCFVDFGRSLLFFLPFAGSGGFLLRAVSGDRLRLKEFDIAEVLCLCFGVIVQNRPLRARLCEPQAHTGYRMPARQVPWK